MSSNHLTFLCRIFLSFFLCVGGCFPAPLVVFWLPHQGLNSGSPQGPWQWERRVPINGPPENSVQFSSVQLLSRVQLFATPWTAARQASLSSTNSRSWPSSRWCYKNISSSDVPFSSCLQSFPALDSFPISQFFTSGGQSTGALFSFSISPSKEYSGLISFRIDWFDLLEVQGTLESLLQHHSSKAPIFWCSACFMV